MTDVLQTKSIAADKLGSFVDAIIERRKVFAPVVRNGLRKFQWVVHGAELSLKGDVPRNSPKEALLPRTEVLFYYRLGRDSEEVILPKPPQPQVLFGLHPADVAAVGVLDAVFSAEPYPDKPYLDRRAVTAVVAVGVPFEQNPDSCFCHLVGISTMSNEGADVFLAEVAPGRYVAEILTDRGAELAGMCEGFEDVTAEDLATLHNLRDEAAGHIDEGFDPAVLAEKLDAMFDSEYWQEIAHKCVSCGACAYLCPTCHCFDISEETRGQTGARVRNWDTCQFQGFTRHASGHNPRDEKTPRCRQRIMHKFNYGYRNFQRPFCTGCGRCVNACPANNDLRDILAHLEQAEPETPGDGS